jgi:HlyD family secretion protein
MFAAARRPRRPGTRTLPAAIALACALASCARNDGAIRASGTIELDEIDVSSMVGGRIVELRVNEGDAVRVGDTLAVLDRGQVSADFDAQAARARGATASYQDLVAGSRPAEVVAAQAELDAANAALELAQSDFTRAEKLAAENVVAQADLDRARSTRDAALARVRSAREQLKLREQGYRNQQIAAAHNAAQAEEAQLRGAKSLAEELVLTAPVSGVVLLRNFRAGELAAANVPVVTLGNPDSLWMRVYVAARRRRRAARAGRDCVARHPGEEVSGSCGRDPRSCGAHAAAASRREEQVNLVFGVKVAVAPTGGRSGCRLPRTSIRRRDERRAGPPAGRLRGGRRGRGGAGRGASLSSASTTWSNDTVRRRRSPGVSSRSRTADLRLPTERLGRRRPHPLRSLAMPAIGCRCGREAADDVVAHRYMSQAFGLIAMTIEEELRFYGGVYGIRELDPAELAVKTMRLTSARNQLAGTLSGGNKQRLALGCALMHEPPVLFLDEPTAGVDLAPGGCSGRSPGELSDLNDDHRDALHGRGEFRSPRDALARLPHRDRHADRGAYRVRRVKSLETSLSCCGARISPRRGGRSRGIHGCGARAAVPHDARRPVLQLILFGYASRPMRHLPTAVFDQSQTQESRALVERFARPTTSVAHTASTTRRSADDAGGAAAS